MSTTTRITELYNFSMTTYNGKFIDVTVEDLKSIHNKLCLTNRTTRNNGISYILLFDKTLLAIDESFPTNKLLLAKYNILPTHPPLDGYEFDLVFKLKTGVNQPEIKLSEALSAVNYRGKTVTNLSQIYMQELIIVDPTPIYANISWTSEDWSFIPNEWITIPYNTITKTTDDISIVPRGIIAIKRPGIYLFNGCFTPYDMNSWFKLSLSKNFGVHDSTDVNER